MKRKIAVLLGGMLAGFWCFFGAGKQVYAEETLPDSNNSIKESDMVNMSVGPAYLMMKEDSLVYTAPGETGVPVGVLHAGQPAITFGRMKDGWLQIYYIGQTLYIPENVTTGYNIPEPVLWQNLEIQENMKINVLGDSITYGDKLRNKNRTYADVLTAKCGTVVLNKYGLNGSSMAGTNPGRFLDRYPEMDRDAEVVLVFGGSNDYAGAGRIGTPLGTPEDLTEDTFYGGLNLLMCGLKQMYPDSEIVFMTPLRRWGYTRQNKNGCVLAQYVTAVQERAAFWGIRMIDLYNEPELDFTGGRAYYLVDGLHPNESGHALIGDCVYRRLFENS